MRSLTLSLIAVLALGSSLACGSAHPPSVADGGASPGGDAGRDAGLAASLGDGGFVLTAAAALQLGSGPSLLAAGDFDRDGKTDALVLFGLEQSGSHAAQLFLGNGDGTFRAGQTLETGQTPRGVAIADFNGDGKLDAAIGVCADDGTSAAVLLFVGDGKGGFASAQSTAATVCPFSLSVADVNGDGQPDLVTAGPGPFVSNATSGEVRVLGGGQAQLALIRTVPFASAVPLGAVAVDVNGDGKVDLALTLANSELQILLGDGRGDFAGFAPLSLQHGPYRNIQAGDIDGDGRPDLALESTHGDSVALLLNRSQAGAVAFAPPAYQGTGRAPVALALADLGGQGTDQIATANATAFYAGVTVLQLDTKGELAAAGLFTAGAAYGIASGDFNGDGRADLVITDENAQTLTVLLNGSPEAPPRDGAPFAMAPHTLIPPIPNNGGAIIKNVRLVTLTYDDDPQRAQDEAYAAWIVQSRWLSQVGTEYGVGPGSNLNVRLPGVAPTTLLDSDVQALVANLIADGGVPAPAVGDGGGAPSELYMMYFPASTSISGSGLGQSCQSFGGYHNESTVPTSGVPFSYGVIPTCGSASETQITVSHELLEAVTDPFPMSNPAYTSSNANVNGWIGEVGDLCTFYAVQEGDFLAQRIWSNAAANAGQQPCVPAPADAPYVGVSTTTADEFLTLAAGQSLSITLTGWSTVATQPFSVSISPYGTGLLQNNFQPTLALGASLLSNGQTTTLTVGVPSGTPSGSYATVTLYSGLSDDNFEYWPLLLLVR